MTVYVDPPLWPRHGTIWGHLISDSSLEELHRMAALVGIPERGFDADHYDVPERLYGELEREGVVLVDSRTLVRILRASGLRVTAAQRKLPSGV